MMNGWEIVRGTPIWVWCLALFLLWRGIKALSPREIAIKQLFILPSFFLVWGIYNVISQTALLAVSLAMFIVSLGVGLALGLVVGRYQSGLGATERSQYVLRPGSSLPLVVIVLAFAMKFWLSVNLALHAGLATDTQFCLQFGGLTGLVAGVLWGTTLRLFVPWYDNQRKYGKN